MLLVCRGMEKIIEGLQSFIYLSLTFCMLGNFSKKLSSADFLKLIF